MPILKNSSAPHSDAPDSTSVFSQSTPVAPDIDGIDAGRNYGITDGLDYGLDYGLNDGVNDWLYKKGSPNSPEMDEDVVLSIRGLSKRFDLHLSATRLDAVENVWLDARAGQFTGLAGASGSGKSSILKCLYRRYVPSGGEILYRTAAGDIVDLVRADDQYILDIRRTEIRFVSQFLNTLPRQSARDVVATPLIENGLTIEESRERAEETLARIGVPAQLWNLPPLTFSGGERQLVNMARALVVRPRLLLLDEPTASLDPLSTQRIVTEIERLKSERVALVGVFHDRSLMNRLADHRLELAGGMTWENTEN